jgi:hypothetical protein
MTEIVAGILSDLCVTYGLCIPPDEQERLARLTVLRAGGLADAVLRADGLDPELVDRRFRREVHEFVARHLRFPCPCCGYLVHEEPPGSYDICPICFWEDDALQLEFATTLSGGANRPTLLAAQQSYATIGACEERILADVRLPTDDDRCDAEWRPIDPEIDFFPDWNDPDPVRAPVIDLRLYYWRADFWYRREGRLTK